MPNVLLYKKRQRNANTVRDPSVSKPVVQAEVFFKNYRTKYLSQHRGVYPKVKKTNKKKKHKETTLKRGNAVKKPSQKIVGGRRGAPGVNERGIYASSVNAWQASLSRLLGSLTCGSGDWTLK